MKTYCFTIESTKRCNNMKRGARAGEPIFLRVNSKNDEIFHKRITTVVHFVHMYIYIPSRNKISVYKVERHHFI